MPAPPADLGEEEGLELLLLVQEPPGHRLDLSWRIWARGEQVNFTGLVLSYIEVKFFKKNMRWKALVEIYKMHSFAPFTESANALRLLMLFGVVTGFLMPKN